MRIGNEFSAVRAMKGFSRDAGRAFLLLLFLLVARILVAKNVHFCSCVCSVL